RTCAGPGLPNPGFDVRLGADDDVHDGAVVEIRGGVELRAHAALVELAALLELLLQHVEQVVLFDALDDLLLVVERDVRGDGVREHAGLALPFVRHSLKFLGLRRGAVNFPCPGRPGPDSGPTSSHALFRPAPGSSAKPGWGPTPTPGRGSSGCRAGTRWPG